jgi:hypothetical protein
MHMLYGSRFLVYLTVFYCDIMQLRMVGLFINGKQKGLEARGSIVVMALCYGP